MDCELRIAEVRDSESICTTWIRSIREVCAPHYGNREDIIRFWCSGKTPEQIREMIESPDILMVVAVSPSHEIIGIGAYHRINSEILALYLAPEACGFGVGRKILRLLEKEAKSRGATRITLGSTLNARPFYENCGFVTTNAEPLLFKEVLPYFPMEKQVS